jgi:hypothetical protein
MPTVKRTAASLRFFCGLAQLSLERADFLEAFGYVAQDRDQPDELVCCVSHRGDREFNGNLVAVLLDSRNRKNIAVTVAAFAAFHDAVIAVPMALLQPRRDDDVQRSTNSICARIAEDPLCAGIPEDDDSLLVGGDNRIGVRGKNGFCESSSKVHCDLVEFTWRSNAPHSQLSANKLEC